MERYSAALELRDELWRYWQTPPPGRLPQLATVRRDGWQETADQLRATLTDTIDRGEVVFVTADICRLMDRLADEMPEEVSLVPEHLFAHRGLICLGRQSPVAMLDGMGWDAVMRDGRVGLAALTWTVRAGTVTTAPGSSAHGEVLVSCYAALPSGRLDLLSLFAWPVREPWNTGLVVPDTAAGAVQTSHVTHIRRWLLALFTFVSQRLVTRTARRADRATRRRLGIGEPPTPEPRVQVVELRARDHPRRAPDPAAEKVAWSRSWIVRGHWRRQFYPSRGVHAPRWIAPYWKGDLTGPVKPPNKRVFLVRR